jgi:hypothetical protein
MSRIKWREVFKFLSRVTFAGALANLHLWLTWARRGRFAHTPRIWSRYWRLDRARVGPQADSGVACS